MISMYKFLSGATRDPRVKVDYYTSELVFENPLQLVSAAGLGFEHSPVEEVYIANDSQEIDYTDLVLLTLDHDTSDGTNEHSYYQYRVLIEYMNSLGSAEAVWSDWHTTLDWTQDIVGTITDSVGQPISIGPKTLRYYKYPSTGDPLLDDYTRDILTVQIRFSIPVTMESQLKMDLTPAIRTSTAQNLSGGRPAS